MAKLDQKPNDMGAKKRKHSANDDNDGVPCKTLIVETPDKPKLQTAQKHQEDVPKKAPKRKCGATVEGAEIKKAKKLGEKNDENDGKDDDEDDLDLTKSDMYKPTLEELKKSEEPENVKGVETVRQKKRQKHQQRVETQKVQSIDKEVQRNQEYLHKWKNARDNWKFEKLRQISIQQSAFDESKIDNDLWPITLEYLSGSQGAAKEKIIKLAENVIDQLDGSEDGKKNEIIASTKYRRARELVQSFI